MKKLFALLLALVMVLSLTACGGGRTEAPAPEAKPAESGAEAAAPAAAPIPTSVFTTTIFIALSTVFTHSDKIFTYFILLLVLLGTTA